MSDKDPLLTNKILGALLLAGVFATGSAFIAGFLYVPEPLEQQGFIIETPGQDDGADTEDQEMTDPTDWPGVEAKLASVDPADGVKLFKKCSACHTITNGGANRTGPNLWGVVGRGRASADLDYNFSSAFRDSAGEPWTLEALNAYLYSPKTYIPGTKMSYAGLKKPKDRAVMLRYLQENGDR